MVTYPDFLFAAPPRCATRWFMQAAVSVGLGTTAGNVNTPPSVAGQFLVSIVRHPYDWLVSYYLADYRSVGWSRVDDCFGFKKQRATDLEHFITQYLQMAPGAVGALFDSYRASTSIRVEDLPWSAVDFFSPWATDEQLQKVAQLKPINCRTQYHKPNQRLRAMVMRAERDFCERYNYFA